MNIHIATDHAGFAHKEVLKEYLQQEGHTVVDHGAFALTPDDDYPDFVTKAAIAVAEENESSGELSRACRGIVFGYSGQGEAMAANRIKGVRAAVYYGKPNVQHSVLNIPEIVKLVREHNDANVLSIGAHFVSIEEMIAVVEQWLATPFSQEKRHVRRINKF